MTLTDFKKMSMLIGDAKQYLREVNKF